MHANANDPHRDRPPEQPPAKPSSSPDERQRWGAAFAFEPVRDDLFPDEEEADEEEPEVVEAARSRRASLWLFGLLVSIYLLFGRGRLHDPAGVSAWHVTDSLLRRGTVTVPANTPRASPATPGGPHFSRVGIGQSLVQAPFYLLGRALAVVVTPKDPDRVTRFFVSLANAFVTALTALVVFWLAEGMFTSRRVGLHVALLYGLGTFALPYATSASPKPILALCFVTAFYGVRRWVQDPHLPWPLITGAALGFALLVDVSALLSVALPIAFYQVIRYREGFVQWTLGTHRMPVPWRQMAYLIAPATVLLVAALMYNQARFGVLFISPEGDTGLRGMVQIHGWTSAAFSLLVGPARGWLVFALPIVLGPFALMRLGPSLRWETAVCVFGVLVNLALSAVSPHRLSGASLGPAHLLPATFLLILPLGVYLRHAQRRARRLVGGLALFGVLLAQLPALLVSTEDGHRVVRAVFGEDRWNHHPQLSPLWWNWLMVRSGAQRLATGDSLYFHTLADGSVVLDEDAVPPGVVPVGVGPRWGHAGRRLTLPPDVRASDVMDLWFAKIVQRPAADAGGPLAKLGGVAAVLCLIGLAGLSALRLWPELKRRESYRVMG